MRILFVGGGTGGHLTPALGLAEALEARGHETLFLLAGREVEQAYIGTGRRQAALGYEATRLPKPVALLRAMWRARRVAACFQPQVTVALGGAASAAALGVPHAPLVLLEGNAVPGKSVRWMQHFAIATLTMYGQTAARLRRGRQVGPLARAALAAPEAAVARRALGLDPERPVLLCCGGSQGAEAINQAALAMVPELQGLGWQLFALTGVGKGQALHDLPPEVGVVREHCAEMGAAYAASDFALCRGGASTLGELWLRQLPALILPYPHHRDQQQRHNAEALAPGLICHQQFDQAARAELLDCLQQAERRERMAAALAAAGPRDGRALAVAAIEEIGAPPA